MAKTTIGLKQGKRLCQLSAARRLEFLAEGLPMILGSAQGFWKASQALRDAPREADILAGYAEEEAAKILILIDTVRCPSALLTDRLPVMMGWFYSHLARLLYAEAQSWRPTDIADLQTYLDGSRRGHDLEGYIGEYIVPNWHLFRRESQLYVDIASYESGELQWSEPMAHESVLPDLKPPALRLVEAFAALGMFSVAGLKATGEVWGQVAFSAGEGYGEQRRLTETLLERLIGEGLPAESATQKDGEQCYRHWQLPMYGLDFSLINVSLEELRDAQEEQLYSEMGFSSYE